MTLQRISLRVNPRQVKRMQRLVDEGLYPNQSEAYRAAIRRFLDEEEQTITESPHGWMKIPASGGSD